MDYQKAYTTLFNVMTDCVRQMQKAQQETEEMYIEAEDGEDVKERLSGGC